MNRFSIGVDVGGTFTDLVAVRDDGLVESRKVLSTPGEQSRGVLEALDALGEPASSIERFIHGTTVATNTLLERTGARVVLCATAGATDLLDLRRQERAALYDLTRDHPPALVPPEQRVAIDERIDARDTLRVLERPAVAAAFARVRELEPETIAVSLLHAYRDPSHEQRIASAFQSSLAGVPVICSSDVLPEIREYERTATTVAEAYLRPRVARYLHELDTALRERGAPAMGVMTSSGGVRESREAGATAAALALSGPAGGVVAAAYVARAAGFENALAIDIGGTSADAGLILDGEPLMESGGAIAGIPIALPRVLVDTVSAGGGSIAWIDDGGALRVGPRSAGAKPGPVAFGRGGTEPTVTDAHLVLGNIRHARLSGDVTLDSNGAHRAVSDIATRLGVSAERAASAIIAAADAAVARALRRVSVERGVDPRRMCLVAFGGGGPLHACALAEHLGVTSVLVPPQAGVLSALGLAIAADRREALASVMRLARELDAATLNTLRESLVVRAGAPEGDVDRRWWVRARYQGQGHELEVPLVPDDTGTGLANRFAEAHGARYGFTLDRTVEIIGARHSASGKRLAPRLTRRGQTVWDDRREDTGGVLDVSVRGRSVITLPDATVLVADGWTARAMPLGGWLIECGR
ncbi:MAG TPA: hydantoinase/oxoprolinase family protein [Gemmatimonadaceae bacterium]|nr:hydantoinase/oxoprolinase family protein [Gemmatimonadaceae bacterium]